jgi:hypothetical protein
MEDILSIILKAPHTTITYGDNIGCDGPLTIQSCDSFVMESSSTFCSAILTPYGKLIISDTGTPEELDQIADYYKSRFTLKLIVHSEQNPYGLEGPFYQITHVDGYELDQPQLSLMKLDDFYSSYTKLNEYGNDEFELILKTMMKSGEIQDKLNLIPNIEHHYSDVVLQLMETKHSTSSYESFLRKNKYSHIFGLLLLYNLIV